MVSVRYLKVKEKLSKDKTLNLKLTNRQNLVEIKPKKYALCEECFLVTGAVKIASHPDENQNKNKLCSTHARLNKCNVIRYPCVACPDEHKLSSSFPDQFGNKYKLCANHARINLSHAPLHPCVDCPTNHKLESNYSDEHGVKYRLCATHAKERSTLCTRTPCQDCKEGEKKIAQFKDENGHFTLCTEHAKAKNLWKIRRPCEQCEKTAHFPNLQGEKFRLCTFHAKSINTYSVRDPCTECSVGNAVTASFADEDGNITLCAFHAYKLDLISKPVFGCSKVACEVWDLLEKEWNIKLRHAHYDINNIPSILDEYKIPNTKYRVDAYDETNQIIFEFFGCHCHGYPPTHPKFYDISPFTHKSNADMYFHTMERMKLIQDITKCKIKYIWSYEYDQIKKSQVPISQIIHDLDDELIEYPMLEI